MSKILPALHYIPHPVIAEKNQVIAKKDLAIAKKDQAIAKKDQAIAQKDEEICKLRMSKPAVDNEKPLRP